MMNIGDSVQIAGCSTKKRLLESSSGCESFDTLIGGALVNSSIVLIDEYRTRSYASLLTRAFLAEGVHHGHRCFVADLVEDPKDTLLKSIPTRKEAGDAIEPEKPSSFAGEEEMKIAWRYGSVKKVSSSIGSANSENAYDFSKSVESPNIEVFDGNSLEKLYERLCELVKFEELHTKSTGRGGPKKNLLRVVLQNLDLDILDNSDSLPRFLSLLRSLSRSSYMIVYLTANSFRVPKPKWTILESFADTHIQLAAFNEEEKKVFRHLGNAHGYFRLQRLPRLLSVGTHTPPILDLIFEASSRKGLQVRVMHLPPAFDEPAPGQQTACQSIDF